MLEGLEFTIKNKKKHNRQTFVQGAAYMTKKNRYNNDKIRLSNSIIMLSII